MMEADIELAQRLRAKEQGEITIEERSRLFAKLMNRRKKHFAKLKAEEIRRNPPNKAQKRNQMSIYLKNMAGYKHKVVKGSKTRTEESSKRVGDELESNKSKKQKGIDREDLETLLKLVKEKHGINMPVDEYERVLSGDMKVMFEPDIKSKVWRSLQRYKVTVWKLFDSRRVHFVRCVLNVLLDDWIMDSGCIKHMPENRRFFISYKAYDVVHVVYVSNLKGKVIGEGYSQTSKAYIVLNKETMRIEESLNVAFDESLPEPKSYSSVEDDRINEPIVQDLNGSPSLQVNVSDEGYPKSVKEVRGHPTEHVTMALLPLGFLEPLYPDMINNQDIEHMIPPTPPKDIEPPVESPISLSLSSSVGSSSPIRMAPKRTSTSAAPPMTQSAIKKLVADSVSAALEAQAATMANADKKI
ncbi:hypothetical protein Tco_0337042 [Tanacetum coccineum]